MGYREDGAIKNILQGKLPEKKVIIAVGGKSKEEIAKIQQKKQEESSKLAEKKLNAIKEIFKCSECGKDVRWGSRLDIKLQSKTGKCSECLIKEETKMKINGTYEKYEQEKILKNKLAYLQDQRQQIIEFKDAPAPTFYNESQKGTIIKEKWNINIELYRKVAAEALVDINKVIGEIKKELEN